MRDHGGIEQGRGVIALLLERQVEAIQGFPRSFSLRLDNAKAVPGFRQVRLELQGVLEASFCVLELAKAQLRGAELQPAFSGIALQDCERHEFGNSGLGVVLL
jgi:hypothetical protein